MATLCSRCGHYIFALWFLLSFYLFFPRLISAVTDWMSTILPALVQIKDAGLKRAARGSLKIQDAKIRHLRTITQLYRAISLQLRQVLTIEKKNLLNSNISPTRPYNMVNFGLLAAEIVTIVWGTPANFNGFHVLAALLHDTLVVGISQTLQH